MGGRGSIAEAATGDEVFERLSASLEYGYEDYVVLVALDRFHGRPFPVLVGVVLSQNTNDKNSIKALIELAAKIGVDPDSLARAELGEIARAIRVAGLASQKARALKELAKLVASRGGEDYLLREDPWRLREELKRVKGVGDKTVDVFLSLVRRAPVFAVDTHAARIAKRWRLVGPKAGYSEISRALLEFFGPGRSEEAHRLLIALGRRYCRARNPLCGECPVRDLCPSAQQR